jgi:AAA ATPase-like protein
MRYNPFRPGNVVTPGMFAGRIKEVEALEQILFQAKNGNPQHFLVTGERGIGKSSLFFFLDVLARGDVTFRESNPFNFLVVSVELDVNTRYDELIKKVGCELQRVVASRQKIRELAKGAWDFLCRWELLGVRYQQKESEREPDPHELLEELTFHIEQLSTECGTSLDGILVLLDEADKPPASAHVGEFLKLFTERLTKRGCNNVAIGLAGLPSVLPKLKESHESSTRILQVFSLSPLEAPDRISVVHRGLEDAKQKNGFATLIDTEAEEMIAEISEGYPHFIQQFAYSAFDKDSDNHIDSQDVQRGAFDPGGAFEQLGVKYFEDLYFEKIWSEEYRQVLRVMADSPTEWTSKATIRKQTGIKKETTLSNALAALKKRNIIIPQKGHKGSYRLPSMSFGVWIRAFTKAPVPVPSGFAEPQESGEPVITGEGGKGPAQAKSS